MARKRTTKNASPPALTASPSTALAAGYDGLLDDISALLAQARREAARTVNRLMSATYWAISQQIVVHEQGGHHRAGYGDEVLKRLAADLTSRHGRGFSERNLRLMRSFYLGWEIWQTASAKFTARARGSPFQSHSGVGEAESARPVVEPEVTTLVGAFALPWSHYVRLLSVENPTARAFYEAEALRAGWTVRQLDRQVGSQFYERTALSRDKAAMLRKGETARPGEALSPEQEIKDPFVLEFLDLKDEYSEAELEEALIRHLEAFLLELGNDFTFVGRQRRLRIDDEWFRVDLVFYHRALRCLVLVDLKLDRLAAADLGQMNLYLNYASEHWTRPDENAPVGLILCAARGHEVARYALAGISNTILAAQYRTALPSENILTIEIERTRATLEADPRRTDPQTGGS